MGIANNPQPSMIPAYKVRSKVITKGAQVCTIQDLKDNAKLTGTAEDAFLTRILAAAQAMAENYCSRKFTTTALEGYMDDPVALMPWWSGTLQSSAAALYGMPRGLSLPWTPVAGVTDFSFIDQLQTVTAFDPTSYIVDSIDPDRYARVVLRYFAAYPGIPREILALKVRYTAGYGVTQADVPPEIVQGILMLATFMYDNRGECADAGDGPIALSGASAFLDPYRILRV